MAYITRRGLKFLDGTERDWEANGVGTTHVEYMIAHGIHPEMVDDYFRVYDDGEKEYLRHYYGDFWAREFKRQTEDTKWAL